jgi:uncharacterized membrane protein
MEFALTLYRYILPVYLATLVMSFVSWPIASRIFTKSRDGGYTYGTIMGFFAIAFIYFTLGHLGVLALSYANLFLCFGIWVVANFIIELKYKHIQTKFNIKNFILTQILFLSALTFWAWVRSYTPAIHNIERFMDYGILKSIFESTSLPIEDFWMSGLTINYYYFSHFLIYTLLKLSFIEPATGFVVAISWNFALLTIGSFAIGRDLYFLISQGKYQSKLREISAGLLSAFLVVLAGNFHVFKWLRMVLLDTFKLDGGFYWYADSTRIITDTITEMPIYGLSIADNHPHVWGVFPGILFLGLIIAIWYTNYKSIKESIVHLFAISSILAFAYITNTWDIATLGMLLAFFLVFKFWNKPLFLGTLFILIPSLVWLQIYPWSRFIEMPISGIGIVTNQSHIIEWLTFWGPFVVLAIVAIKAFRFPEFQFKRIGLFVFKLIENRDLMFYLIVYAVSIGFWIGIEIFFIKDLLADGQWYRANTVFKISSQIWLWLGLILGPAVILLLSRIRPNLIYILVGLGLFWIINILLWFTINSEDVESYGVKYSQTWGILLILLFAILGAISYNYFNKFASSLVFLVTSLTISILGLASYQLITQSHGVTNIISNFKGIDKGFDWFEQTYPDDYLAAKFLSTQKKGVIVEGAGDSFEDNNYYSVYLGWPTIIGWANHEWTWRGSYTPVGERRDEVREIYTGFDIEYTREILKKYNVEYIIVGSAERRIYPEGINQNKFDTIGVRIFSSKDLPINEISLPPEQQPTVVYKIK